MKKVLTILLITGLACSLFAGGSSETKQVFDKNADVEITFWAFSKWAGVDDPSAPGAQTGDWERAMAAKFEEMHPNVTVNVEVFDLQAGPEKAAASIAAGETPDVIHDADVRMTKYSNAGYLVAVDEYMEEEDLDAFIDGTLANYAIADGKTYWLPFGTSPMGMMVNKTLFEKAGCADLLPQGDDRTWTTDEFYEAVSTAIANLDGVYGIPLFANTTSGDIFTFIWTFTHGGRIVDVTTGKMACNTPEAKAGLTYWTKLINDGLAAPGGASLKAGEVWPLFNTQQVLCAPAYILNYSRTVSAQKNGTADQFEVVMYAMPHAEGQPTVSVGSTHGFGVWQNDDEAKLYWAGEFARFLASDENATAVKAIGEFSFKKAASAMYDNDPDPNIQFSTQLMNYMVMEGSVVPGFSSLRNEIMPYYQSLYLGEITVDEFASEVEKMGNDFLANYEP